MSKERWRGRWYTEEVGILAQSVRRIFEEQFAPLEPRWRQQGQVEREVWALAGEQGLLCAGIPAEYGGLGGSFAHEAIIYYEQFRAGVSSFGNVVHSGIVAHYLAGYGTEEQKQRWLPRLASGESVAALAMSEPGAGSDLRSLRTTAVRRDDTYVINGSKTFISNGQLADLLCVAVRHDNEKRSKSISLIIVDTRESGGLRRGRKLDKIGMRGQDTSELFFEDVTVPAGNLLGGREGGGFAQMMAQLPRERLIVALIGLGTIDRALATTIPYVKERQMFGGHLLDLQNPRFVLADAWTEATIARSFLDDCVDRLANDELDAETASMAKLWVTEAQCRIVDQCLQLHGGYGYMADTPIAQMYLDSRIQKIYGGANEVMREIIARAL
jgi:acyl-CoA dehydrogenase